MKLKLPKVKASKVLFSLRYFYIIIFILLAGSLVILGNFLYANFYQTISQSEEIILLKQEVAPDIIDTKKVETVLDQINKKPLRSEEINFDEIFDPFEKTSKNNPKEEEEIIIIEEPPVDVSSSTPEQNPTTPDL